MVDAHQVTAWVLVAAVYIVLPFLLVGPNRPRHAIAVRLTQLGEWALPRLQAKDPDVDPLEVLAAAEAARREQLVTDLERLRCLVRSDAGMSATRQLANRMAYDRLLHQVEGLGDPALLRGPVRVLPVNRPAEPPTREMLDLDWRAP